MIPFFPNVCLQPSSLLCYTHLVEMLGNTEKRDMPKSASYTLRWSAEHECYELQAQEKAANRPLQEDWWFAWLAEHSSFSFQGKQGHLSLLKEPRARGADYWYAYRSLNRRTVKKYAGRTVDLTVAHLEELARALASEALAVADDAARKGRPPSSKMVPERHEQAVAVPAPTTVPLPQSPLLRYKLQPPRLHPSLIVRERLLAQLDVALEQPVTLLSAPAGFGKTTLVRQWLAARDATGQLPPIAWIALDEGDNDLLRFWRYMIAACQGVQTHLGSTALAHLSAAYQPPFNPPDIETVLTLLLNDLAYHAARRHCHSHACAPGEKSPKFRQPICASPSQRRTTFSRKHWPCL
jgi:LuxR family maltose regulon positive regulatory protein